jgi:hypothetical protein
MCVKKSELTLCHLFKEETYKHTHDQHLGYLRLGANFFCNDVIFKYWPFALNVAKKFSERPEFTDAVTKATMVLVPFSREGPQLGLSCEDDNEFLVFLSYLNFAVRSCISDTD